MAAKKAPATVASKPEQRSVSLLYLLKVLRRHKYQLGAFILGFAILFLRRPDVLTHAQFWAEDGLDWYQTAYNHHFALQTLFKPYAGYFILFPRLIGLLSGLVGVAHAPLFFNTIALIVEVLPLVYLWSSRFDAFIPNKQFKLFISAVYLTLPYTAEIHGNITNAQWFLSLLAFMILFMEDSPSLAQTVIDYALLVVACLSGPFSIILVALLLVNRLFFKSSVAAKRKVLIVVIGAALQAFCIVLLPKAARIPTPIGPSVTNLFNIVGGQLFGSGLAGYSALSDLLKKPWITPAIAIVGTELMIYVFLKAPRLLKLLILYATLVFVAALVAPNGPLPGLTWWQTLATAVQAGGRYYFLFHLTMVISIGWLIFCARNKPIKSVGVVLLLLLILTGVRLDFEHQAPVNRQYGKFVTQFDKAHPGQTITTFINPGPPWHIKLIKH